MTDFYFSFLVKKVVKTFSVFSHGWKLISKHASGLAVAEWPIKYQTILNKKIPQFLAISWIKLCQGSRPELTLTRRLVSWAGGIRFSKCHILLPPGPDLSSRLGQNWEESEISISWLAPGLSCFNVTECLQSHVPLPGPPPPLLLHDHKQC